MSILPTSLLIALTFFWSVTSSAQEDASSVFTQALQSYKAKDFAQSRQLFAQLLQKNPEDPVLLYNMGLVEFQDQRLGRALGYWRKALYERPGFTAALSGIRQVHKVFPTAQSDFFENWFYWQWPPWFFLGGTWVLFMTIGVLSVWNLSRSKKELKTSWWVPATLSPLLLVFAFLSAHGLLTYRLSPQATVLEPKLEVRSSPSEESPSLVEFQEGDQVTILREQNQWAQVQRGATALGWVPREKILAHSGY